MTEAMTLEHARRAVSMADSYSRMGSVLALAWSMQWGLDWWRLLGDEWSGCDNIAAYRLDLAGLLRAASREELDAMMSSEERSALDSLPEMLTVFRGCYSGNRNGLSWTLDRSVAERIVTLNRYRRPGTPLLLTGRVRKGTCALKNDREEREIVSASVRRVSEAAIPVRVNTD